MNCGSHSLICCRLFGVDSGLFWTLSTLNKRAWAARIWQSGRSWMAFWLSKPTQISHPPPSNHQLGLPSSSIKCSKCFWYDGYVLSVLKPFLKRVLHVVRCTILGQYLRVNVLRSFVVYLGQGCLSGSRLSVSRTPCTASWCQPPIDCYTASQRTGVCLSPGLYGFVAWIHIGHSCGGGGRGIVSGQVL